MVKDGLWRAKTDEEMMSAWEESVRLREKMFWARVGGGVVPASSKAEDPGNPHTKDHMDDASVNGAGFSEIPKDLDAIHARVSSEHSSATTLQVPGQPTPPPLPLKHEGRMSLDRAVRPGRVSIEGHERPEVHDFAVPSTPIAEALPSPPADAGAQAEILATGNDATEIAGSEPAAANTAVTNEEDAAPAETNGEQSPDEHRPGSSQRMSLPGSWA